MLYNDIDLLSIDKNQKGKKKEKVKKESCYGK